MADSQKRKVLVVDDTKNLLDFYKVLLKNHFNKHEIEILTACNGVEGCKVLEGMKEEDILCVITDSEMPLMNGQDFCAHLRCIFHKLTIFLHSNTYADNIDYLKEKTKNYNIEVLSKKNSLRDVIIPWIEEKLNQKNQPLLFSKST